jgi:hypothetical protein
MPQLNWSDVMYPMRKLLVATSLLILALLPMIAAVTPDAARSAVDSAMPVAMAQTLAVDRSLVPFPSSSSKPVFSETTVLMLVGSSLFGLAALVRRTM